METKIQEFNKIDYLRSALGRDGDILIVFFNAGNYWLCDKDYGIQQCNNPQYFRVKRVFTGNGKRVRKFDSGRLGYGYNTKR